MERKFKELIDNIVVPDETVKKAEKQLFDEFFGSKVNRREKQSSKSNHIIIRKTSGSWVQKKNTFRSIWVPASVAIILLLLIMVVAIRLLNAGVNPEGNGYIVGANNPEEVDKNLNKDQDKPIVTIEPEGNEEIILPVVTPEPIIKEPDTNKPTIPDVIVTKIPSRTKSPQDSQTYVPSDPTTEYEESPDSSGESGNESQSPEEEIPANTEEVIMNKLLAGEKVVLQEEVTLDVNGDGNTEKVLIRDELVEGKVIYHILLAGEEVYRYEASEGSSMYLIMLNKAEFQLAIVLSEQTEKGNQRFSLLAFDGMSVVMVQTFDNASSLRVTTDSTLEVISEAKILSSLNCYYSYHIQSKKNDSNQYTSYGLTLIETDSYLLTGEAKAKLDFAVFKTQDETETITIQKGMTLEFVSTDNSQWIYVHIIEKDTYGYIKVSPETKSVLVGGNSATVDTLWEEIQLSE